MVLSVDGGRARVAQPWQGCEGSQSGRGGELADRSSLSDRVQYIPNTSLRLVAPYTMALPRGLRALAAITLVLFVVVLYQIFSGSTPKLSLPTTDSKTDKWTHDPQSEGKPPAPLRRPI